MDQSDILRLVFYIKNQIDGRKQSEKTSETESMDSGRAVRCHACSDNAADSFCLDEAFQKIRGSKQTLSTPGASRKGNAQGRPLKPQLDHNT